MSPLIAIKAPSTLTLPPGFALEPLREAGDAFAHACRIAAEKGAGTLVWVRRFDVAEFAIVLEPEEPLAVARKAFFMGMNATAEAIAAHCPPEREVAFRFPDAITFDGGLVGGGRLGWPKTCPEEAVPDWLVFSAVIRVSFDGMMEPGKAPKAAALEDEGFDGMGPSDLVESFARFFLRQVDVWQNQGFKTIAADYLGRVVKERPGDRRGLDTNGDLLTGRAIGEEEQRLSLLAGLKAVAWLDRDTGAPKL